MEKYQDLKHYTNNVDSDDESVHSNSVYDEISPWNTNIVEKKNHVQFKSGNNWIHMAEGYSKVNKNLYEKTPMTIISKLSSVKKEDVIISKSKKTSWCDIAKE